MYIIESEKIGLRGLELEDVKILYKEMNNSNMTQFLFAFRPFSIGEEEDFIKSSWKDGKEGKGFAFAVVEKSSSKLVGTVSLMKIDAISRNSELGIWISEEACGKGYGVDAEKLIIKYGFESLNLHSIFARAFAFNERSAKVIEKAGMKKQGILRESVYRKGKYHDIIYFDILKSEFND